MLTEEIDSGGLEQNMNDEWVQCSKAVVKDFDEHHDHTHEDWLDSLNLHETSWILFVTIDDRVSGNFGWPK